MKKLFILLVVFFATCINTYASNHSAGKNSLEQKKFLMKMEQKNIIYMQK